MAIKSISSELKGNVMFRNRETTTRVNDASNDQDVFLVGSGLFEFDQPPIVPVASSKTTFDRGHHILLRADAICALEGVSLRDIKTYYVWQDAQRIRFSTDGWQAPTPANELPGNSDPNVNQSLRIDLKGGLSGIVAAGEEPTTRTMTGGVAGADMGVAEAQSFFLYGPDPPRCLTGLFRLGEPYMLETEPRNFSVPMSVIPADVPGAYLLAFNHQGARWYLSSRSIQGRIHPGVDVLALVLKPQDAVKLVPSVDRPKARILFLLHGQTSEIALTLDTRGMGIRFHPLQPANEIPIIQHFTFERVPLG